MMLPTLHHVLRSRMAFMNNNSVRSGVEFSLCKHEMQITACAQGA